MKTVKKHIAKRELSEASKSLGYDVKSNWFYHAKNSKPYKERKNLRYLCFSKYNVIDNSRPNTIIAPNHYVLRDWLYEKYKVFVTVNMYEDGFGYLVKHIVFGDYCKLIDYTAQRKYSSVKGDSKHKDPISAMEEGLTAAINYIIKDVLKGIIKDTIDLLAHPPVEKAVMTFDNDKKK